MADSRRKFSICIPAYNRARHLKPLLDSIFAQDYSNFDIVICEDNSRERAEIANISRRYAERYPGHIQYYENQQNLGYDANIRNLVAHAAGEYCFFMGNDDLVCPGALAHVADILCRHSNVGLVLKSYAWFDDVPENINQNVRYFAQERVFAPGREAIRVCYRRSGVISGFIVHRDSAQAAATDQFDGTLFYQMILTASVLMDKCAVFTPQLLVLCRHGEPPEFGNSNTEKGVHVPGRITPEGRLSMIGGALSIIRHVDAATQLGVAEDVIRDYANYFFPYIRDQVHLPFGDFFHLYRSYGKMGFDRYPMFHLYCVLGYLLGEKKFDSLTRTVRARLGRSPHFGGIK